MFADKPHRLNGRMRAAILCFDDLASGYRTRGWATRAAGYRAAISCFDPSLPFGDQFCCVAHQRILFHDLGVSEHAVRLRLWSKEALATHDRYSAALRKTASRVASR